LQVQSGNIDVCFVYIPPRFSSLEIVPIKDEAIQLVGSPALGKQLGTVTSRQLLHVPYIHINWGPPFTEWFGQEVGSHDAVSFRVDHTGVAIRYLLSGEGIGFLLDSIADQYIENGQLERISIKTNYEIPKRTIYMIYDKKNRNPEKIGQLLSACKN